MTHHQLVEEWKEKFRKEINASLVDVPIAMKNRLDAFVGLAMLAAAKGAVEAAHVAAKEGEDGIELNITTDTHEVLEGYVASAWNAAITQSEQQLEEYFKEV